MSIYYKIEILVLIAFLIVVVVRSLLREHNKTNPTFMHYCLWIISLALVHIILYSFPYANYVTLHFVLEGICFVLALMVTRCWMYVIFENHRLYRLKNNDAFSFFTLIAIVAMAVLNVFSMNYSLLFRLNLFGDPIPDKYFFVYYYLVGFFGLVIFFALSYTIIKSSIIDEKKSAIYSLFMSALVIVSLLLNLYLISNIFIIYATIVAILFYVNLHGERVFTDTLTGLNNRNRFRRYLQSLMSASASVKANTYLTYIDIDDFKLINDNYGHLTGDLALRTVAESMRDIGSREHSFLARVGGDEFVIIAQHPTIEKQNEMLSKLTESLNEKAKVTLKDLSVSFSVGFTNLNVPDANISDIIKLADRNMYRNKSYKKQNRH